MRNIRDKIILLLMSNFAYKYVTSLSYRDSSIKRMIYNNSTIASSNTKQTTYASILRIKKKTEGQLCYEPSLNFFIRNRD